MAEGFFATEEKVKDFANMPNLPDEKIAPWFNAGKRAMVKLITKEVYDEHVAAGDDDEDFLNLQEAECYLMLKKIVPTINISSEGDGITKTIGTGDSRQENLSETDLETIINRYDAWAMEILKDYIPEADVDEDCNPDAVVAPKITMFCI